MVGKQTESGRGERLEKEKHGVSHWHFGRIWEALLGVWFGLLFYGTMSLFAQYHLDYVIHNVKELVSNIISPDSLARCPFTYDDPMTTLGPTAGGSARIFYFLLALAVPRVTSRLRMSALEICLCRIISASPLL
jgi:hypothetical protein